MMVRTQLIQLYRQRLLFWLIGVGMVVILPALGIGLVSLAIGDDNDPYSIIGGLIFGLSSIGTVVIGMVIGATAGARDYTSGVMRDYVLTGTSRWKIHLSQFLAALIIVAGLMTASLVLSLLVLAVTGSGDIAEISREALAGVEEEGASALRFLAAAVLFVVVIVLGSHSVGSFVRSRGIAIAIIAGYLLIADNILTAITEASVGFTTSMFQLLSAVTGEGDLFAIQWEAVAAAIIWLTVLVVAPLIRLYRSDL